MKGVLFHVAVVVMLEASVYAQEPISAAELLNQMQQSHVTMLPPLIATAELTDHARFENSVRSPLDARTSEEFVTDNVNARLHETFLRLKDDGSIESSHGMVRYNLAESPRYVEFLEKEEGEVHAPAFSGQNRPSLKSTACETFRVGQYFFGDDEPVSNVLHGYENMKVAEKLEQIDGAACYVLEASGASGEYELWIDPAAGYLCRKGVMHKSGADLYHGQPMNADPDEPDNPDMAYPMTTTEDLVEEISNVEIAEYEGHFFIKKATMTIVQKHKGGETVRLTRDFALNSVTYNPNFDELATFVPAIPSGMKIRNLDFPDLPFIWREGKPMGSIDKRELAQLDDMIDDSRPAAQAVPQVEQKQIKGGENDSGKMSRVKTMLAATCGVLLFLGVATSLYLRRRSR